jgi:hypothetical protein
MENACPHAVWVSLLLLILVVLMIFQSAWRLK